MLNIALFGPPGAGKGTQSEFLIKKYNLFYISTGGLLRKEIANGTRLGLEAQSIIAAGGLVSDEIIVQIIENTITGNPTAHGFLFDGFPRTIPQAEAMREAGVDIDYVVEIDVDDSEIIKRLSGRRVHPGSGRTYHTHFNRPKVDGKDDATGEELIQREDDKEETVRKRLQVYHDQTKQLVDYYWRWAAQGNGNAPKYRRVAGIGTVDEIRDRVLAALKD